MLPNCSVAPLYMCYLTVADQQISVPPGMFSENNKGFAEQIEHFLTRQLYSGVDIFKGRERRGEGVVRIHCIPPRAN